MPKLMIVDDEETIRQGLALAIKRLAPDWDIVYQVEDGLEAVRLLRIGQPDLMIVDISMPGMNGLDLTRYVADHYPDVFQIVLSGHDNFSYVQSTLRSGVVDYLLKPLDRQELLAALSTVRQRIVVREESERERSSGRRTRLEKSFLDWLSGEETDGGRIEAGLREIGWQIDGKQFAVMAVLDLDKSESGLAASGQPDSLLSAFWARFGQIDQYFGLYAAAGHYVLCLEGRNMPLEDMNLFWNGHFAAGAGEGFDSLEELPEAYRRTMQAVYERDSGLTDSFAARADSETNDREERFLSAVAEGNADLAKKLLRQWLEEFTPLPAPNATLAQLRFFRFFSMFLNRPTGGRDSELGRLIGLEVPWLLARIAPPFSARTLAAAMAEFVRKIDGLDVADSKPDSRKVVREAKDYIQSRYADSELSLEQIAQHVYLNPNYFSELFKLVTGDNFIEYLTATRMAAARRLLKETNLKTYEIAGQVGYASPKYFSTLFRKLHGMTPSEFRDSI